MANYPKIWFLRHGQTEWNRAYRLQGQLDSPLTKQGIADAHRQAAIIGPVLAQKPDIYVSPLGRTRQTAQIALAGAACSYDDRLMEIHAGDWQGRLREEILAETGPTVVVAHGLWGQVMRAQVRGLDMETAGHLSNDQGCVYVLENGYETLLDAPQ